MNGASTDRARGVLLTAPGDRVPIPGWIRRFSPRTANEAEVRRLSSLPELTVVRLRSPRHAVGHRDFLTHLAALLERAPRPSRIVLAFAGGVGMEDEPGLAVLSEVLDLFSRPADVEVTRQGADAPLAIWEALAKNRVLRERQSAASGTDALGQVKSVIASTRDLRAPSGRLSATRVADAFGLSTAEIARLAGMTRQALSKTDDSSRAQPTLRALERIARLRARLRREEFRRWLHSPSEELADRTPLEAIREGHAEAIAGWVENLLAGNPI